MRTMYDAVNPANLPDGGDLYAGYVDGKYVNVDAIRTRFPDKRVVTISVNGSIDADVIDIETGNISPANAVAWVTRQRARGGDPTAYFPESWWPTVRGAFQHQNVAEPYYWVANYEGNDPTIPTGAVAKQYGGNAAAGYDISSVADHWPGIDSGGNMLELKDLGAIESLLEGHFSKATPPNQYEEGSIHWIIRNRNALEGINDKIIAHIQDIVAAIPITASPAGVADPALATTIADELARRLQA